MLMSITTLPSSSPRFACAPGGASVRETSGVPPETHYARSGDVSIAYQVLGDGPFDVVFVPPTVSNVELGWEVPGTRAFLERLGCSHV
jgi:hypothetical protein